MRRHLPFATVLAITASGCLINADLKKASDDVAGSGGTSNAGGSSGEAGTGGSSAGTAGVGGTGAGGSGAMGGSGGSAGAGGTSANPTGQIRFALFSSDIVSVHICSKPAGADVSEYTNQTSIKYPTGLSQKAVTAYVDFPVASMDFAVVDGQQTACDGKIAEITALAVEQGSKNTLIVSGNPTAAPSTVRARVFADAAPVPDKALFRFLNAYDETPDLDIGFYSGLAQNPPTFTSWSRIVTGADGINGIGETASASFPVNARGYATSTTPFPGNISYEARGTASGARAFTVQNIPTFGVNLGEVATLFFSAYQGDPVFVWCSDNAAPIDSLSPCQELPFAEAHKPPDPSSGIAPLGKIRLAHLTTDTSETSVDVCAKPSWYPIWRSDDAQVLKAGMHFGEISGDISVSIDPDGLDIKVVDAATPPNCASAPSVSHQTTTGEILETTNFTLAITGITGEANFPFSLRTYPNIDSSTSGSLVRFVHVAPKVGDSLSSYAVDLSIVDATGVSLVVPPEFSGAPYGNTTTDASATLGYLAKSYSPDARLAVNTDSNLYSAELSGNQLDPSYVTTGNNTYTYWLVGEAGNPEHPPILLVCRDSETHTTAMLDCFHLPLN